MSRFQAKFTNPNAGWDSGDFAKRYLEPDKFYDIEDIIVYAWNTDVFLKDFEAISFNSAHFTFYIDGVPAERRIFFKEFGAKYDFS